MPDATDGPAHALAHGSARDLAARAAIAAVGVLLASRLSLWASGQLWRHLEASLQAWRAGGLTFYLPLIALLLAYATAFPARSRIAWMPGGERWTRTNGLVLAIAVTGSALLYGGSLHHLIAHGLKPSLPAAAVINGALVGPVAEEWLFRGLVWSHLRGDEAPAFAAVWSSVLFALWHLPFAGRSALAVHFAFGMLMALLRWRFRSVGLGAAIHAVGNALAAIAA